MNRLLAFFFPSLTLLGIMEPGTVSGSETKEARLAHDVYFTLNDNSDAAKEELVAACKKYLTGHPGTLSFAAGVRAGDLNRPVNDQDFDVYLQVVFANKAAHDQYQTAERHVKFGTENKANWKKVRVFDSYLAP